MNTSINRNDQITGGIHALLEHPWLYSLFQRFMGVHNKYRMYVADFLKPFPGCRILDIGCGYAEILNHLPKDVDYVGYDISPEYIAYARKRHGHRAAFFNQRVNEIQLENRGTFDIVLADGLLHHLSDAEAGDLFKTGSEALRDTGFMFTADPTLIENQGLIPRWISLMDRGRHVRYPMEYKGLAEKSFPRVEVHIIHNVSNRPQTGCFLKCYKILL